MEDLYTTGKYWRYHSDYHREDAPWKVKKIISVIPQEILDALPETIKVIDIGCGSGKILKLFSAYLKEKNFIVKALGYDVSEDAIEVAKMTFPEAVFYGGEFKKQNFRKNEIDFILLIDLLEHLKCPQDLLSDASAICKYAICHLPLEDNLNINLRCPKEKLAGIMGHINFYNTESSGALFEKNGFSVENKILNCFDYDGYFIKRASLCNRYFGRRLRKIIFKRYPGFVSRILGGCSAIFFLRSKDYNQGPDI